MEACGTGLLPELYLGMYFSITMQVDRQRQNVIWNLTRTTEFDRKYSVNCDTNAKSLHLVVMITDGVKGC
jgi:hypothetical protein